MCAAVDDATSPAFEPPTPSATSTSDAPAKPESSLVVRTSPR